jgi:hypothetical protein
MAIYVPGVPQYFPEFKPYTPDFKFLSNVLEARQQKYDTNFKALNDQYNRVVYGDLSRADTQEAREQFVNNLSPQLEKISGMDLSLAENVNAAQGVFAPFYQEEVIVKDLVYTKAYNNELQKAKFLRTAADENQRRNWWSTGDKKLQYDMQQFKNASREEALQMGLPKYVVDPDLYNRGRKYLESKEYNVVRQSSPKKGNFFIIENKNGDEITELALNDLTQYLKNDPIIADGYFAQAYVDSMDAATEMLNNNEVSSLQEGVTNWSSNELTKTSVELADKIADERNGVSILQTRVDKWNKQIDAGYPPAENSQDFIKMQADMALLNVLSAKLERDEDNLSNIQQTLLDYKKTGDPSGMNSKAWQFLMTNNLRDDYLVTARNFSQTESSTKYIVNEEEKQRRSLMNDWLKKNKGKTDTDDKDVTVAPIPTLGESLQLNVDEEGILYLDQTSEDDIVQLNNTVNDNAYRNNTLKTARYIVDVLQEGNYVNAKKLKKHKILPENSPVTGQVPLKDALQYVISFSNNNKKDFINLFYNEDLAKLDPAKHKLVVDEFKTLQNIESTRDKAYLDNLTSLTILDEQYKKDIQAGELLPFDDKGNFLTKDEYVKFINDKIKNKEILPDKFKDLNVSEEAKDFKKVPTNIEGDEGLEVNANDVYILPTKWVEGKDGNYYLPSSSIVGRSKAGAKALVDNLLASGKWKLPRASKAEKAYNKLSDKDKNVTLDNILPDLQLEYKGKLLFVKPGEDYTLETIQNMYVKDLLDREASEKNIPVSVKNSKFYKTIGAYTLEERANIDKVYDKHVKFLNKTLSDNTGYSYKNSKGKAQVFKKYYQHSAFSADNPANNLITTTVATILGSKAFKKDPTSAQLLNAIKDQFSNIQTGVVDLEINGEPSTAGLPTAMLQAFDLNVDQKNVTFTYVPATKMDDQIKAQYIIKQYGTGEDAAELQNEYVLTFDQSLDQSPAAYKKFDVLDPVKLKIQSGDPTLDISIPDPDSNMAVNVDGGSVTVSENFEGQIFIKATTKTIDKKSNTVTGTTQTYGPFDGNDFMAYNRKYEQVVQLIYQVAETNLKEKKGVTKNKTVN